MGTGTSSTREERRQRAVEGLLLTPDRSEGLARVTRVARLLFDVRWSTVTVLDGDTAVFPAATGVTPGVMPRRQTFCHTTGDLDETLHVADARRDERFAHLDLVTSGQVVFYAGVPLHDGHGNVVGTLCLFDDRERELDHEQRRALADLAHWAQSELTASSEMAAAERVQASMLPSAPLSPEGWQISGVCLPALAVGGDFFDHGVTDGVADLVLGDVMGKGTGAALVGAGVRAAMRGTRAAVAAGVDLGVTSTQVARALLPDLESTGAFVTLLHLAIDLDDGWTRFVDAGLGLALVARADGGVETLGSEDLPFGIVVEAHWTEQRLSLAPGDRLVVFSDGLLDLLEDDHEWAREIAALVREAASVDDLLQRVVTLTQEGAPNDDVTVLAAFRDPA